MASSAMSVEVLRLFPGQDVWKELEIWVQNKIEAASILSVVSSLTEAYIR